MGGDGSGARRAAVVLLSLIAGLSLVVGALSLAARGTLFDPSTVTAVSSRLLDQPAVRTAIAHTLTTRLRSVAPALREPAVSDGLERLATALTDTERFRGAFRDALARLQMDLLARDHRPVALRLETMLDATRAELQEKLGIPLQFPQTDAAGRLTIDPGQVQAYRDLLSISGQTGWPAIAIGGLAAIGALVIAERRRRAMLSLGATVATIALIGLGGLALARSAAASRAAGSTSRAAVDAAWSVMAGDARTALIAVMLAGMATAVLGLALQAFGSDRASR
ncbi:MAG: hypothetical protein ABJC60_10320 [Actinomycetota bacterium]